MVLPVTHGITSANNCLVLFACSCFERNVATDTDKRFERNLLLKALPKDVLFAHPPRLNVFFTQLQPSPYHICAQDHFHHSYNVGRQYLHYLYSKIRSSDQFLATLSDTRLLTNDLPEFQTRGPVAWHGSLAILYGAAFQRPGPVLLQIFFNLLSYLFGCTPYECTPTNVRFSLALAFQCFTFTKHSGSLDCGSRRFILLTADQFLGAQTAPYKATWRSDCARISNSDVAKLITFPSFYCCYIDYDQQIAVTCCDFTGCSNYFLRLAAIS